MNEIPVYASTGAFITRRNGRDYRMIKEIFPRLQADGIEFMMYSSWDGEEDAIRREIKGARIPVGAVHMDKSIGDALSENGDGGRMQAVKMAKRDMETALFLGADTLVLHLWNGPFSDDRFSESLPALDEITRLSEAYGLTLAVENVICKSGPALDRLRTLLERNPRCAFTYDTKMAHLRGENAMLSSPEWRFLLTSGAIRHLHVNDSSLSMHAGGRLFVLHPGEGEVDFASFFRLMRETGFSGSATVESTSVLENGEIDLDALNRSLIFVKKGLNETAPSPDD